jgi:hypothetical protein
MTSRGVPASSRRVSAPSASASAPREARKGARDEGRQEEKKEDAPLVIVQEVIRQDSVLQLVTKDAHFVWNVHQYPLWVQTAWAAKQTLVSEPFATNRWRAELSLDESLTGLVIKLVPVVTTGHLTACTLSVNGSEVHNGMIPVEPLNAQQIFTFRHQWNPDAKIDTLILDVIVRTEEFVAVPKQVAKAAPAVPIKSAARSANARSQAASQVGKRVMQPVPSRK